jgi:subfamily B ATP-binding cassette protein MsbA
MLSNNDRTFKILISSGEVSGDQHSAKIVNELKSLFASKYPNADIEIKAMGGSALRASGAEIIIDSEKKAAINGFNLFSILTKGLFCLIKMIFILRSWKPNILILTDYPDFNLRLARFAKWYGVPSFYYIPPKVWAWRSERVKTIKKLISHTAVIFPFEKEFFNKHKMHDVTFVGHPFSNDTALLKSSYNKESELKKLGLNPSYPTVAVFTGSRKAEVKRHLTLSLETLKLLKLELPNLQAIFAVAPSIEDTYFENLIKDTDWIKTIKNDSLKVLAISDAGLLKSGTCNLEAAFLELPFVCYYKASKFAAWLVGKFITIKEFSLVNIILPQTIKEFLQNDATAKSLSAELKELLTNNTYRDNKLNQLARVRELLNSHENKTLYNKAGNAASRTAYLVLDTIEKTERRKKTTRRLFKHLRPYRGQFIAALICMVIFGASDGVVPFLVKYILDGVFANQDKALLAILPFIMLGFTLIRASADFGQEFLAARVGHNIVRDIRTNLHNHILKLTPEYFVRNSVGTILSRFTSDVVMIGNLLTTSLSSIIRDTIRITALLATAFYLDPWLATIAFIFFPLGLWPVYKFGKRMRKLSRLGQDAIGSISSLVQESVIGSRVVKIFNQEAYEAYKFSTENQRLRDTFVKSERIKALTGPINEILGALAISGVILYGGMTVINGVRSQGDFIAFLLSVFLLYDPFKKLSRVNNSVQQGIAGAERIFELLDTRPSVEETTNPIPLQKSNAIDLENVSYAYSENEALALDNIQLHIPEGTTLAIVGYSGSGKSTLVDLIPRFINPTNGLVKIGGVDISKVSLNELRSRITMVSQHTFLFNDTVYNNIAYGNLNASIADVTGAAMAAHAHEFIMRLPNQYQTVVGQDGYSLSGGERQRISIARALLKNSPILILDEATAALDNRSEREVQAALELLQKNRTTLVIAHRLSTIQNADCIIVMENGKIVEAGKHQELLDQGGLFARLHALQFAQQDEESGANLIN